MVGLDVPMGKPSYVKGIEPIEQPSKAAILAPSSSDKFIGIKEDLLKLTRSPVDLANFCSISLRAINWLSTAGSTTMCHHVLDNREIIGSCWDWQGEDITSAHVIYYRL